MGFYSLLKRLVAAKVDAANLGKLKKLAKHVKRRKLEFHTISAVIGWGLDELKRAMTRRVRREEPTA